MSRKYPLILLAVILCTLQTGYTQKNEGDYIVKDTLYTQGKVIPYHKRGVITFQKTKKEAPLTFSANDLKEFGFHGRTYESLTINGEKQFVKRIVLGEHTLYRDNNSFIVRENGTFTFLTKKNFKHELEKILPVTGKDISLSRVTYNNQSMKQLINLCNAGNCTSDKIPYPKLAFFTAYNSYTFRVGEITSAELTDKTSFISLGVVYDFPFYKPASLYVTSELNFISAKPSFYQNNNNVTDYLALDLTGINAPIGIKWVASSNRVNLYLKTGVLLSYMNVSSPSGVIQTIMNGTIVEISTREVPSSGSVMMGYHLGAGIEIPVVKRSNIHFESKYIHAGGGDFNSLTMNFSGLYFMAGYNF
jgi:hypothetical protein